MDSSAPYLKLVWSATSPSQPSNILPTIRGELDAVYAALQSLRQLSLREARRMMLRMIREHKQARSPAPARRSAHTQQLELFPQAGHSPVRNGTLPENKVIYWRTPYLLEQHSGPCPRCGRALVERSRVGASIYFSCMAPSCPNREALFLLILGTGDD